MFAALGEPTRLQLVIKLSAGGARSIATLAAGGAMSRQAVTKHLRVLEQAGLVAASRTGRERRFTLQPQKLAEASDYLSRVAAHWDEALERLKRHVEG